MRIAFRLAAILLLMTSTFAAAQPMQTVDVDAAGMGRAFVDWPREVPCEFSLWAVRDDWRRVDQQWSLIERTYERDERSRTFKAFFKFDDARIALTQRTTPTAVSYTCVPDGDVPLTGLFWFCGLPADRFAGGEVLLDGARVRLPTDKAPQTLLGQATAKRATFISKDRTARVEVRFPEARLVRVQDARTFGAGTFQLYTPLAERPVKKDERLTLDVSFAATVAADAADATVTVDATKPVSRFDGFGGNFVYAIGDATTELALRSLKLTWARTGVAANEWEPANDDADATTTNWRDLEARDVPGSTLRARFELDRRLFAMSEGRLIASLWYPPEWLFERPLPHRDVPGRIPRERWEELVECVTSYLVHLRKHYSVEPALFSFNESDIGIYVRLDGEEMRDLTKLLGDRFAAEGLRTKILLGDSADLKLGLEQVRPTLADAAAARFVGALAYHPWAGQNELWGAWATLAAEHKLPLFATEMGADPQAWHDATFNEPLPTLRLARRYVEQLRDARTQALLEWEWTGDYPMSRTRAGRLTLAPRGEMLRQLTRRTPTFGNVVASASDRATLVAAAVSKGEGEAAEFALHVVNLDTGRRVHVRGLPAGAARWTFALTDPANGAPEPRRVEVIDGACTLELPAGAIGTLSTLGE